MKISEDTLMSNKFTSRNRSTVKYFTPSNNIANNSLTQEDMRREIYTTQVLRQYAIPILLDQGNKLEDFEEEAEYIIMLGKELPEELKKKLLDTLEERKLRNKKNGWLTEDK